MTIVTADLIITIAYFSIPIQLVFSLVQYPRLTKVPVQIVILFILFALFILCCGVGHLFRCMELGQGPLFQTVNIITATVSLSTAVYLLVLIPTLMSTIDNMVVEFRRSSTIIQDMYPPCIRDRLFESLEDEDEEQSSDFFVDNDKKKEKRVSFKLREFLHHSNHGHTRAPQFAGEPIAEDFCHTSIMFADIVGFTQWSDSRTNHKDVFVLLERLFWEFDQLAQLMDVFKLSSVGDCYIAVTGVPDQRDDQAVVMAEFARAAQRKSQAVFRELNATLDTECLNMRFGLHTGPIVGGVLRGQKSRFELFGDSINTASRMESTGLPGEIQVSADFARILQEEHGLSDWVKPREGLVSVKGKGDLPTFWLTKDDPIRAPRVQTKRVSFSGLVIEACDDTLGSSQDSSCSSDGSQQEFDLELGKLLR